MQIPSIILQLNIQKQLQSQDIEQTSEIVSLELSKESLNTMLEGLGRIRDQLSNM